MPYIYLLKTRASLNILEPVYKIGKTQDFNKRLSGYDKGSEPILVLFVKNCDTFERILLELFNTQFRKRDDYGNEYFEGNVSHMIQLIMEKFNELNMCYSDLVEEIPIQPLAIKQEELCKIRNTLLKLFNKITSKNINKFSTDFWNVSSNIRGNDFQLIKCNINNAINNYNSHLMNSNPNIPTYKKFGDYLQNNTNLIYEIANYSLTSNDEESKRICIMLKNII
jgi:hypothetical protein